MQDLAGPNSLRSDGRNPCWVLLGFILDTARKPAFLLEIHFFFKKNPSLAAPPPDFKPAEMRNQTRKNIFKSFCTRPPRFHVKDGKFPRDKHPGNQKPCQKALSYHSHVYREPHRGYHRGLREEEAVIQRALRSGFAFFGALDDFWLAAVHRASCQEAGAPRIR